MKGGVENMNKKGTMVEQYTKTSERKNSIPKV